MTTKIEIIGVSKRFGPTTVIDNMSATFLSGKIIGLKGINGSGKTMLMRLIAGLIKPSAGTIKINDQIMGKDISFPPSIGLLLENPAFLDAMSGMENLKLLASIKRVVSIDQIRAAIDAVGLDSSSVKKYRKYSLGMKQRLGIAAALMENPDIIILDEPTNSLDTAGVGLVKNLITVAKNRGALILLASHDFETLSFLSDEIYHIEEGKISGPITVDSL